MTIDKKIFKKAAPHLLAWGAVIFVNLFSLSALFSNDRENFALYAYMNIPIWLLYIGLFYFNLHLIIPKLLFKTKYLIYCVIITFIVAGSSIGITYYKQVMFRNGLKKSILKEAARTDITAYRKNRNIKRIDSKMESTYQLRHYNPFTPQNTTNTYGLFLIIATSLTYGYISRWKKREQMVEVMNKERIESELAYLKQQINPHFLFNALNSIYSLVLPHSDEASEVILKLSSILRYMLYETDKERVPLTRDLEIIADYIDLQKLKCTAATEVEYHFEGDFNNRFIEPLIMIPIIENAFKYGSNSTIPSIIKINVETKNDRLYFSAKNKIVVVRKNDEPSGIGLKNISRRLDIIYGKEAKFEFFAEDNYFTVNLSLPLSNTLS